MLLVLTAATSDVLAFIRRTTFPLSVYRRSAARVWPIVRQQVNRRISRFGVPLHEINIYRRYTTEMLKAFRTETGEPLAAALELCLRKWANLGLAPALLPQSTPAATNCPGAGPSQRRRSPVPG